MKRHRKVGKVGFSIYQDTDMRKHWQIYQAEISNLENEYYNVYKAVLKDNIHWLTPWKTGRLDKSVTYLDRGFLKFTVFSDVVDPKTGEHYTAFQHEIAHVNYTTPGTRDHFISIPFYFWTGWLHDHLYALYQGNPYPTGSFGFGTQKKIGYALALPDYQIDAEDANRMYQGKRRFNPGRTKREQAWFSGLSNTTGAKDG